jgi:hypothetical protein
LFHKNGKGDGNGEINSYGNGNDFSFGGSQGNSGRFCIEGGSFGNNSSMATYGATEEARVTMVAFAAVMADEQQQRLQRCWQQLLG